MADIGQAVLIHGPAAKYIAMSAFEVWAKALFGGGVLRGGGGLAALKTPPPKSAFAI